MTPSSSSSHVERGMLRERLANAQASLGVVCTFLDDLPAKRIACEQARDIWKALAEQFPGRPNYRHQLAEAQLQMSTVYFYLKEYAAAREEIEQAEKIARKLVQQFPGVPYYQYCLASSEDALGNTLQREGDTVAARNKYIQARNTLQNLVDQFPALFKYRTQLAGFEVKLGENSVKSGQPAESLDYYSRAIKTLTTGYPNEYRNDLRDRWLETTYRCRAQVLILLKRYSEAVEDWDRVIPLSQPRVQHGNRLSRAEAQIRAGQVEAALKEADELSDLDGSRWAAIGRYRIAALYAYASGLPESPPRCADRAMELLKRAIDTGFKTPENITKMADDHDLDPLRERDDFRSLMKSIGAPEPNASIDSPARP